MSTADTVRKRYFKEKAQSLNAYMESKLKGIENNRAWLAKQLKVTKQQVDRWLGNSTLVVDDILYLQKSSFKESVGVTRERNLALKNGSEKPIDLATYIDSKFDGNQTLFAIEHGTRQQQVNRWVHSELPCVFFKGQIYRARITLPNKKEIKKLMS